MTGMAIRELTAGDERFIFWRRCDCDLTAAVETRERLAALSPGAIVNPAAVGGGVALSRRHPASLLRDNVLINLNVLEAARLAGTEKVVLSLSSGMYAPGTPQPYRESSIHNGAPDDSNYSYAHAKRLIEPMIRAYREEFGMLVVGLSPNGVIGPHDHFHPEESNMTAALIQRMDESRDGVEPIVIWGDGSPLRELSDSRDIARDFLWALEDYDSPAVLNVGTSEEMSVRDVATSVATRLGIDPARLRFDSSKPSGVPRKRTDTSRYAALSGAPYVPIREALARAVDWYVGTRREDPGSLRVASKLRLPARR